MAKIPTPQGDFFSSKYVLKMLLAVNDYDLDKDWILLQTLGGFLIRAKED